jgi:hypothetical protein
VRNLREIQDASIEMEETGDFYTLINSLYFMSSVAYTLTHKCITGEEFCHTFSRLKSANITVEHTADVISEKKNQRLMLQH